MCRTFSKASLVVDQDLGDVGQPLDLLGGLVPAARDEALHLADRDRQIGQRRVEIGPAVVEHAGQRRQPVLEQTIWSLLSRSAVTKVCRFLMMSTMLPLPSAKIRADAGQLRERLPQLLAVAVQRVGGAVDEPATPRCPTRRCLGPEIGCQAHQLGLDLIPLDGHGGAVAGDHRAVGHRRAAAVAVGRRELDVARRDQVLRDDDGLGVGGDRARRGRPSGSSSSGCPRARSSRSCRP